MKLAKSFSVLVFGILTLGLVSGTYTGSINTDETEDFSIDGSSHTVGLNFVDGGASIDVDGVKSEYFRPLDSSDYGYGLYPGDTFTVNGVTVEVREVLYDREQQLGTVRFTAYEENRTKRIREGQERQFHLNGETHVLALKYVDRGAAVKLNDEEVRPGEEIQEGESFISGSAGITSRGTGSQNGEAYLDYQILDSGELGYVEASCQVLEEEGPELDYSVFVPDFSNYRALTAHAKVMENGETYELMSEELELEEGDHSMRTDLDIPTPLSQGEHEVVLELDNRVGSGSLSQNCGTYQADSGQVSDVSIEYERENGVLELSAQVPDGSSIESYGWDLNGDGEYEESGKTITYRSEPGERVAVSVRATDGDGNTEVARQIIEPETTQTEGPEISLDEDALRTGETLEMDVSAPQQAEKGYKLVVEDPSGENVWSETAGSSKTFSVDTSGWAAGSYSVKMLPQKSLVDSVLGLLTGSDSLASEEFEILEEGEEWKAYCRERGYDTGGLEPRIDCIESEIVPTYFEGDVGSDTQVAESLCGDLLGYRYDREEKACIN